MLKRIFTNNVRIFLLPIQKIVYIEQNVGSRWSVNVASSIHKIMSEKYSDITESLSILFEVY